MTTRAVLRVATILLFLGGLLVGNAANADAAAMTQEFDEEVPPGNPVIGSEAPGDIPDDGSSYGWLVAVAGGLIVAGVLLVKVERWERNREQPRV